MPFIDNPPKGWRSYTQPFELLVGDGRANNITFARKADRFLPLDALMFA